jgi:hypothetical protein
MMKTVSKTVSFCSGFLLMFTLCCLFAVGWAEESQSPAAAEPQRESVPQDVEKPKTQGTNGPFDADKYAFSNLPEFEREQISQEAVVEGNVNNSNQLMYDFRAKQETFRLYQVILLAAMSLCALAIVLKYMKDSKTCQARDMLNGTGLVLVIFSTVLVIIIADVEIQLTAAMGVLGGIAGYLFGTLRSSQPAGNNRRTTDPAVEKKSGSTEDKLESNGRE